MTAPNIERDDETIIVEHLEGVRPAGANVFWNPNDSFTAKPADWGNAERDPWVESVRSMLNDAARRALGVTTSEVLEHLGAHHTRSERETQAARVHAGLVLRACGWMPRAQSTIAGRKSLRRYFPLGAEQLSTRSPHGDVPGAASLPAGALPPKNSAPQVDPSNPDTWPLLRKSGVEGIPDWVRCPRTGQTVPRPLPRMVPSARVSKLLEQRQQLAHALAEVDAELARLNGGGR
jgi:hypothetical protein